MVKASLQVIEVIQILYVMQKESIIRHTCTVYWTLLSVDFIALEIIQQETVTWHGLLLVLHLFCTESLELQVLRNDCFLEAWTLLKFENLKITR